VNGHDDRGRFTPGNPFASLGGRRRAERLTPEARRAIAALGFRAMCAKHFGGDSAAAGRAAVRNSNGDAIGYGGSTLPV